MMSLVYEYRRNSIIPMKEYNFSKDPLDGGYLEDNLIEIVKEFYQRGVVVNGIMYTMNKHMQVCTDGADHYTAWITQESFLDFFLLIMKGVIATPREQGSVMTQIDYVIRTGKERRLVVPESWKQAKVMIKKVEIKESEEIRPAVIKLVSVKDFKSMDRKPLVCSSLVYESEHVYYYDKNTIKEPVSVYITALNRYKSMREQLLPVDTRKKYEMVSPQQAFNDIIQKQCDFIVVFEEWKRDRVVVNTVHLYLVGMREEDDRILGSYMTAIIPDQREGLFRKWHRYKTSRASNCIASETENL